MMWRYGLFGFHGFGLFRLLMGVLIVLLVIYLVRRVTRTVPNNSFTNTKAMNILRERYARGEMDSEEYQRRKEELIK